EQKVHYTCLEHKEISELAPGVCPKCGKKLERMSREGVRKPEAPAVAAPGLFVCPDHPEILTTTAAKCGKCGKDLVPKKPDPMVPAAPLQNRPATTRRASATLPASSWTVHRTEISAIVATFVSLVWISAGVACGSGAPILIGILFGIAALAIWLLEVWSGD